MLGKPLRKIMEKKPVQILIKPVVSEKSVQLQQEGKYVFEVAPQATKIEIGKAVEEVFKVKVTDVNIIKVKGKTRRFRFTQGRTKDWKKAIVTLKEGDKIELFE